MRVYKYFTSWVLTHLVIWLLANFAMPSRGINGVIMRYGNVHHLLVVLFFGNIAVILKNMFIHKQHYQVSYLVFNFLIHSFLYVLPCFEIQTNSNEFAIHNAALLFLLYFLYIKFIVKKSVFLIYERSPKSLSEFFMGRAVKKYEPLLIVKHRAGVTTIA